MRVDQQRWLEAEVERLGPLEAIVRDLAGMEPTEQLGDSDYSQCKLCHAHNDPPGQPYTRTPDDVVHDAACPWLRARALFPGAPRTEEDRRE